MSVLIGGGSGFVGRALTCLLKSKGYNVQWISRQGDDKNNIFSWTNIKSNGLPEKKLKAVVNVAGENILNPFKRFSDENYKKQIWSSRIDTNKILACLISESKNPPDTFITMSGVGFYQPSQTMEYTEESIGGSGNWLSDLSRKWEDAGNLQEGCPTRRVIVRSGVILGKDGGMIKMLKPQVKLSFGQIIGSGHQYFPWIHIEDIVGIIMYAIENNSVTGILNGVAPEPVTNSSFTKEFAKANHRWVAPFPVPKFAMNLIYGPERAMVILEGQKVLPKRVLELGYQFKFPSLRVACEELAN